MDYQNTELHFLERDCALQFGEKKGAKIFRRAAKLYAELSVTTDYKNSPLLERQLKMLVYPVIAYYKTLLAEGVREPEAVAFVRAAAEKAAKNSGDILHAQTRKHFPFYAFRRNIKNFMAYKFPAGAWVCTPPKAGRGKVGFQVKECLYYTITRKFGCPELCAVFCDYEDTAFRGLAPKIVGGRKGELATGHDVCNFFFRKGK